VLASHPEVGIVTAWVDVGGRWYTPPCPTLPLQLLTDDTGPATLFRAEALAATDGFRPGLGLEFQSWDAANAVLGAGWAAVTFPAALVVGNWDVALASAHDRRLHLAARRELLDRVPRAVEAGAAEMIVHLEHRAERARLDGRVFNPAALDELPAGDRLVWSFRYLRRLGGDAVAHPVRAAAWITPRLWRAAGRALGKGAASSNGGRPK
jgi:hypothetical protein